MDWTAPINIYCERLSAEFWAEPLNAFSNLAFILAALIGYIGAKRHGKLDPVNAILIGLAATIGVGSFLFHTFANEWSELADQIPIGLLAVVYIAFAVRRFLGQNWGGVVLITLGYFVVSAALLYVLSPLADGPLAFLNGSHIYAPVLMGLVVLALALQSSRNKGAPFLWFATGTFVVSLTLRSIDMRICEVMLSGTHFLWHTANGVLIGTLLVAIILHGNKHTPHA